MKTYKPSTVAIVAMAMAEAERLKSLGWTKDDFAKALKEMFDTPYEPSCEDLADCEIVQPATTYRLPDEKDMPF